MSEWTDRITDALREHERTGPPLRCVCGGRKEYRCVCYRWEECECNVVTPYDDHPAHVAEQITEALQLTEETRHIYVNGQPAFETRWASKWITEQEKS